MCPYYIRDGPGLLTCECLSYHKLFGSGFAHNEHVKYSDLISESFGIPLHLMWTCSKHMSHSIALAHPL